MAGVGDLLYASSSFTKRSAKFFGIEIDPVIYARAKKNLSPLGSNLTLIQGDAFHPDTHLDTQIGYDLVITNPPYVRYQSLSELNAKKYGVPSALQVRNNLLNTIETLPFLSKADRNIFSVLASEYSGHADLAVPAWVLCGALTRVGGALAIVVPETWLSRDYSSVIRYMMHRLFDVRYIIDDAHAAWFDEALVRTTVLVATRKEFSETKLRRAVVKSYIHGHLVAEATTATSIVGNIFPSSKSPELQFFKLLKSVNLKNSRLKKFWGELDFHYQPSLNESDLALTQASGNAARLLPSAIKPDVLLLPRVIERALTENIKSKLVLLESLKISTGQGLRTGANKFFYSEFYKAAGNTQSLIFHDEEKKKIVIFPTSCVRTVLRKQTELPAGYVIFKNSLKGRVLLIEDYALPEDVKRDKRDLDQTHLRKAVRLRRSLPGSATNFIREISKNGITVSNRKISVHSLSAVKTNKISFSKADAPRLARYWYMLPPLSRRHQPDIVIARINADTPKSYLIQSANVVVDANFSTLSVGKDSSLSRYGLLALMNSTWVRAVMEHVGAVMGGGALKLEATHIKRIGIPKLQKDELLNLNQLGKLLTSSDNQDEILLKIDDLLLTKLVGKKSCRVFRKKLLLLAEQHLMLRTTRFAKDLEIED